MEEMAKFNIKSEIIKVFEIYNNRVSAHRNKFFKGEIQVSDIESWNAFRDEVVELTKCYNNAINRLKESKIFIANKVVNRNLNYLDELYSEVTGIEEKYNGDVPNNDVPFIMSQIKILSRYKMTNFLINEIYENSKFILSKKRDNVETLQDNEGKYIFVADSLKEKFDKLVNIQKILYGKYLEASEFAFGVLNEEEKII